MRNILAFLVVSSVTFLLWDVLAVLLVAGRAFLLVSTLFLGNALTRLLVVVRRLALLLVRRVAHLLIFAVLDWLLGAFLLVHCFAILFWCALALFGVLRLTLLLGYLVTLLVLNSFASFVWDFCAFLAVAGLAHLVLLALVPIGRLTLFSWHSITFLCVHRVALVLVSRLALLLDPRLTGSYIIEPAATPTRECLKGL